MSVFPRNLQDLLSTPAADKITKCCFAVLSTGVSGLAALCYCYFVSSRIPKGFFRLISLFPVFYFFTILPLYFPSVSLVLISALFITWLANFKLILFAFGQGPLISSDQSSKSLQIFIVSAAFPVRLRTKPNNQLISRPAKKLIPFLDNLGAEILASAFLIGFLVNFRENLHPKITLIGYCCLVFLIVDCLVASSSFLVHALVGLELEPPSNEPYLSTSLQEFWGWRWNLAVANMLREAVYKPVKSASAALLGNGLAPLPAVLAAFLVSGLVHELLLYYVTGAKPSWEMASFFVLQGICVVLEFAVKKALDGRLGLPWFVSRPLTVGFVGLTSFWLFFPPLIRSGADAMAFEEFRIYEEFVHDIISLVAHLVGLSH